MVDDENIDNRVKDAKRIRKYDLNFKRSSILNIK